MGALGRGDKGPKGVGVMMWGCRKGQRIHKEQKIDSRLGREEGR